MLQLQVECFLKIAFCTVNFTKAQKSRAECGAEIGTAVLREWGVYLTALAQRTHVFEQSVAEIDAIIAHVPCVAAG